MAGTRRVNPVPPRTEGSAGPPRMNRRSSGDQVAGHIRRLIFDGRLRQGDRVRQDEIAAELGVSRIPVREAIIALDREGWVTIEPHRGAFVHGLDEHSVRDQYELLGLIFALAARRATERGDRAGVVAIAEAQAALAGATTDDDVFRQNEAFLRQLFAVAGSARLRAVSRIMQSIVPGNFFAKIPGAADVQREGTAVVVAAMRGGDAEAAGAGCLDMLRRQADLVTDLLGRRGILTNHPAGAAP